MVRLDGAPDTEAPLSPCTGVCSVDEEAGWCRGCYRTMDEIACWREMNPAQQRSVLRLLPHRRAWTPE